ncbi:hypothetical protein [Archangium sp.]|uniref:hypothetical protein n=1 Tax=Archangium sp. TaxID=1872627 RepID=UPI002D753AA0|nr:hypothetical protein [Archangium sp.]HYO53892.1 hypothetical protein [Archangium sp.]
MSRLSPDDPAGRTNTLLAQHCPHLARFDSSRYTREAGKVAKELVNAKCLESLCDSSGPLIALEPTARGQMQQLCGQLRSTMERQKEELNKLGRRWCPEAVQVWEGKPWSAAAHRRFYEEKRRCFEQGCRTAERGDLESGTYMDCEIAADTAEALGAPEDAARLREVARVVEARWRQMRESLTPEERKARNEKAMRRMAEAWNEECREGNQRLCAAVAMYCSAESEPSELCPKPGRGPAAPDAGNR